jgi:hypothetical protein
MEGGVNLHFLIDRERADATVHDRWGMLRCLAVRIGAPILIILVAVILVDDSEASGEVLDNFEWKVPQLNNLTGYDQRSEALLTDAVTGEVYIVFINREIRSSDWVVNSLLCAQIDAGTGSLIHRWAFEYKGNTRSYGQLDDRAFLVHDSHFYFLFYSEDDEKVHLRIDGATTDILSWKLPADGPVPYYRIIGIDRGRFYFMVMERKDRESWFFQYTVYLDDFDYTKVTVLMCPFEIAYVHYLFRDGQIYFLIYRILVPGSYPAKCDFVLDRINTRTGERLGLRDLDIGTIISFYDFHFDIDSEENLHIVIEEQNERLVFKVNLQGDVLSSVDLETLWGEGNESVRIYEAEIIVNRTDNVYVIARSYPSHHANGALVSFVLSSDYSGGILRHIINGSDPQIFHRGRFVAMNGTGAVYVAWYSLVEDLTQVMFCHQIPLTPDLEPVAIGFRVSETPGGPKPVEFSIPIANVGRARSRSHWVELSFSLNGSEPFETIVDIEMDRLLRPGTLYDFDWSMAIPQGSHLLRVKVHDVSPYENNVLNNVFQTWFYVANNNPPTVEVVSPEDGFKAKDQLVVAGITDDIEPEGELITYVTGLPSVSLTIEGRGPWNSTIDLVDVQSGEYILGFRAYDGQDYSRAVYRRIKVSRDVDQLRLDSLYPSGDITLIEGLDETFFFNVTDPLARSLDYRWRYDLGTWSEGSGDHHFIAERVGDLTLRVEVTNGITSLYHSWNITVLPLIPPRIGDHSPPDLTLSMRKRESLEFSISVLNPHDLPFSLIWTLDGEVMPVDEGTSAPLSFDRSGEHQVSILLIAADTTDSVTWDIIVTNSAPILVSWNPPDLFQAIEEEGLNVTFEVLVNDDDGDRLFYVWTVDGTELLQNTSGIVIVDLPCENDTAYEVWVQVFDGEAYESLVWTIQPQPPITPTVTPEDTFSWRTVGVSIAFLLAVVGAMAVAVYHVRRQQRRDPD